MGSQALMVRQGSQGLVVPLVYKDSQVHQDHEVSQDQQVTQDFKALWGQQDRKDPRAQ